MQTTAQRQRQSKASEKEDGQWNTEVEGGGEVDFRIGLEKRGDMAMRRKGMDLRGAGSVSQDVTRIQCRRAKLRRKSETNGWYLNVAADDVGKRALGKHALWRESIDAHGVKIML